MSCGAAAKGLRALLQYRLRQEREQIGRFMQLVVEHKHKIGFQGTLLIEPNRRSRPNISTIMTPLPSMMVSKQFGLEKRSN